MLTCRQLTLQCYHHSPTHLHSPSPRFIQNQAPIHRPSHHLYAHYQNPYKVYTPNALETNISLTSPHIFADLNVKTT